MNAQDFETLFPTVHCRALATASQAVEVIWRTAFVAALTAEVDALFSPVSVHLFGLHALEERLALAFFA